MSLYLEHFGLREPPFRITPHTDFFFTGANRGPTLDALIYAITQDEGIVKVTGEVGSGKTMLCRMLLDKLPANVETLYLANPSLSRTEILGAIADELGLPTDSKATHSLTRALQDALIQRYAAGKRVVVLIDEAHAMPAESLEEIRLLSNLESKATKLLQIALFAQPELEERLAAADMRQLRERITQHFNLAPLKTADVSSYIEFRLRAAGYRGPNPFTGAAISSIAKISEGLSRRINILADKSLLSAYANGRHQVDQEEIRIAAQDARFSPLQPQRKNELKPLFWAGAGASVAIALAGATYLLATKSGESALYSVTTPAVSSIVAPPKTPLAQNVQSSELPPSQSQTAAPSFEPPAAIPETAPVKTFAPSPFGPHTQKHLGQYAEWIATTTDTRYFIQLLVSDARQADEIEYFFTHAIAALPASELRAYRSSLSGHDRVGIIFGDYPSREAAQAAIRNLPDSIQRARPFPRAVAKLR